MQENQREKILLGHAQERKEAQQNNGGRGGAGPHFLSAFFPLP